MIAVVIVVVVVVVVAVVVDVAFVAARTRREWVVLAEGLGS